MYIGIELHDQLPNKILEAALPVCHSGDPGSIPGQVMWDLWWTKWHLDRFTQSNSVSTAVSLTTKVSILICHLGLVQ
jgi:hypothetical protein